MSYDETEIRVIRIIAVAAVAMVGVFGGCSINTTNRIADAIKAGADPIKANCALGTMTSETLCAATIGNRP